MATQTLDDQIRQAEAHITDGAYGDALNLLHEVLSEDPTHTDALNDAAIAYKEMGDVLEAVKCLEAVLQQDPTHSNAFFNLLDTLALTDDLELVIDAYLRYEEQIPDTEEKVRYAERITSAAHEAFPVAQTDDTTEGYDDTPRQEDTTVLKVAIVCNWDRKFIKDIERELGKRHRVRTAYFDDKVNLQHIQQVMDWADVTWFEWCNEILVHASQKLRKTSAVVCRLHRYEAFTDMPKKVDWSFVDTLIPTTQHILKILDERAPKIRQQTDISVISSTVDVTRFTFKDREPGFNIAYLGYLHHRKNPSLLLQCLHALISQDNRYHLHVAGYFQQPVWETYFDHMLDIFSLRDYLTLHGWVEDVESWLSDKHYLVLPTIHEGNPYSVLEAAACGVKPLIHSFPGSEELYPIDWTFRTAAEFADKIQHGTYDPKAYRRFAESSFSLDNIIEKKVLPLLTDLANYHRATHARQQATLSPKEEISRLQSLSKFSPGSTNLLGQETYFCDAPTFLWGYKEIFDDKIYHFEPGRSAPRIIDCGANIGLAVLYWKQQFPNAEIFAFEPDPIANDALSRNIQSHSLKSVKIIRKGVWKNEGEVNFCSEGSTAGRLEEVNEISSEDRDSNTITVPVTRLRDYLTEQVDLLKIDIEGAEFEVLKDCSDLLYKVKNIFLEYHSFPERPQTLSDILCILSDNGFRYHIKPGFYVDRPFIDRTPYIGMDNQVNIYAYR